MKVRLFCFAGLALSAAFARPQASAPPRAVPVRDEPHHHLVLENAHVRVLRVSVPAHDATLLHQHDVPYVYLALGPADVINAVAGKPEAHLVMADGQVGYSRGGFAHIARTDKIAFNNVTIELLHPQGQPRNLCEKIVDGPFKDCASDYSKLPPGLPLMAFAEAMRQKQLFETDKVLVTSFSLALPESYTEPGSPAARLLVVENDCDLRLDLPGEPSKFLHGGDILWLDAGEKPTIAATREHQVARFLLLRFEGRDAAKNP